MPKILGFMSHLICYLAHSGAECTPVVKLTEVLATLNPSVSQKASRTAIHAVSALLGLRICFKSLAVICKPARSTNVFAMARHLHCLMVAMVIKTIAICRDGKQRN